MALLSGILFDATHALNPIFLVVSIIKTFFRYCALVLYFTILCGIVWLIITNLQDIRAPQSLQGMLFYPLIVINYFFTWAFFTKVIPLTYLAMVGAYLLGHFYWWNKDKLDWGL